MSTKLCGIVIEDLVRNISSHEKLVLAAYTSFAWRDGSKIYPCQETIAELALCSPRMVRKARDKFLADGVFVKLRKRGKQTEYGFVVERAYEVYGAKNKAAPGATINAGKAEPGSGIIVAPDDAIVAPDDQKAAHGSGNPIRTSLNPCAPSAAAAENAAPVDAHWRASEGAIRDAVGDGNWRSWVSHVWVKRDFNGVMTLAVPSNLFRDEVFALKLEIEAATGRVIKDIIVQPRLDERRAS